METKKCCICGAALQRGFALQARGVQLDGRLASVTFEAFDAWRAECDDMLRVCGSVCAGELLEIFMETMPCLLGSSVAA